MIERFFIVIFDNKTNIRGKHFLTFAFASHRCVKSGEIHRCEGEN